MFKGLCFMIYRCQLKETIVLFLLEYRNYSIRYFVTQFIFKSFFVTTVVILFLKWSKSVSEFFSCRLLNDINALCSSPTYIFNFRDIYK
jgi:hypothetical protein